MASGLLEPSGGGEQLCVFLLRAAGRGEEDEGEEGRRREVGCQWEGPEQQRREVGCQSDVTDRRDAAVQVDLLSQQLSWRHSGPPTMLLQCFAVRPDGPHGGALLQHCTSNQTRTRTRTRTVKPAIRLSPSRSQTQRRPPPQHRRRSHDPDTQEEEAEEEAVAEEEVEEDTGDPTWTPPGDADPPPSSPSAVEDVGLDGASQHAAVVKLEPDSTVCDVCGKVMKNKSSLARHSFIHTGRKPFSCHLCELRFNRRDNLQHHLSRLHPDGVAKLEKRRPASAWLCAVCGKTFSCRSRLKTHEVIHSGVKPHRCDLCPKAYMRTNDLQHHRKVAHVDGGEARRPSSLLCDLCGKEFRCRSQLAVHFQTHTGERPHLCDICGRKFGRQYQLKRHKILVHANGAGAEDSPPPDAPFPCDVCGKRLKTDALRAAHARIHANDKPHRCSNCPRSFQRAACLKQHQLRIHLKADGVPHATGRRRSTALPPPPPKVFPCPVCNKVFKFKSLLASHSTIHSDVRPFACDFCSRSFRRLSHLKRHRQVVHADGARPPQSFICHVCGKDKKCRSQLARHVLVHTGERPFACDLCPARFNRRGNLQQHRRRMHGVGAEPTEEAPPILFDEDVAPALTYKQEETVVAVDAAAADLDVVQQLVAT